MATFLTQDPFAWMKTTQPLHKGLVAPAIAGGNQGTIRLELRNQLAEILSLTVPYSVEKHVKGVRVTGPRDGVTAFIPALGSALFQGWQRCPHGTG